ncbi:hypothetical protein BsWGS_24415 [Bradybaena similaris]
MNRLALSAWIILSCLGLSYSGCPKGWFGSKCQYKCRCADQKCNAFDGNCLDGVKCMPGWFGPACQYEDLVKSATLDQNLLPPFVVRDGNDHTCVDDSTQQVVVSLTIPYEFTWLRAVVKDPEFLSTMSLHFKTGESADFIDCTDRQQARVSETTMDIHCDMRTLVKQVILTGEGVKYLCSLYISGGRNEALKQRTTQSSTYHELSKSLSGNAVDGNRDSEFQHGSCTHTDINDDKPTWSVYLPDTLCVNRYVLYNRNQNAQRLQRFLLESYHPIGDKVFTFKDMAPTFQDVYTITSLCPWTPISVVTIQVPRWDVFYNSSNFLTLCEVEIFGDTVCAEIGRLYGRECEHKCNCADSDEFCFDSTGGCPSGCAPGFRGESCGQVCRNGTHGPDCSSCSQFCRMGGDNTTACDRVNGACLFGCQPGYFGSKCYEECKNGHYGQDCNATCPRLCMGNTTSEQRVCHHVDGACLQGCQAGYTGSLCDQRCDRGRFGQDCNSTCPQHCGNIDPSLSVCDHMTGICTQECQPGYTGDRCDEQCERGTLGPDCSSTCPQHCENINISLSVCDHVSGVCTQGCQPGYTEEYCDEQCQRGTFGQDCNSTCPQHCENNNISLSVCDHVSGVCTQGCQPGYTGDRCDERCNSGIYGRDCNSTCPQHCGNIDTSLSVCDHVTGVCTQGCQPGYTGDHCDEQKDATTSKEDSVTHSTSRTAGAVAGGIIVAVVVVVGFIILWRLKKYNSFKTWTPSHNSWPKSESTAVIVATEMSGVDNYSL